MHGPEFFEKQAICKFLDSLGPEYCWYFKPHMAGFGKSGVPDILGSLCGACFGVEVKRPGKQPTPIQKKRMDEISRTNGIAIAGDSETVIRVLTEWLQTRGIRVHDALC